MRVRTTLAVSLALLTGGSIAAAGCSSDPVTNNPPVGADGSTLDARPQGTSDGGDGGALDTDGSVTPPDPQATATGTRIGGGGLVLGVTADGNAVFQEGTDVKVTPIAGTGTGITLAASIGTLEETTIVRVAGNVVFVWTGVDSEGKGQLKAWKTGMPTPAQLSNRAFASTGTTVRAAASRDGTQVVFLGATADGGVNADVLGATMGGGAPTVIRNNVDGSNNCTPEVAFANATALSSVCDVGSTTRRINSYAPSAGWLELQLGNAAVDTSSIQVSENGNAVLIVEAVANGNRVSVATGFGGDAGLPSTEEVVSEGAAEAVLSNDGARVAYRSADGVLHSVNANGTNRLTLLSDVGGIFAVSPDFRWALTYAMSGEQATVDAGTSPGGDPQSLPVFDVRLEQLDTSNRYALVPTRTGTAGLMHRPAGDGFTKDSTRALFFSAVAGDGTGILNAAPASAGTTPTPIATGASWVKALTGGKVAVLDKVNGDQGDIRVVDTATGTATAIATRAGNVMVNAAGNKIVYAAPRVASSPGIYVADVP